MDRPNDLSLLGLPSELRSQVLSYVVFHQETDGIISPRPDRIYSSYVVEIEEGRYVFSDDDDPDIPGGPLSMVPYSERLKWEKCPNYRNSHFCTLDCLAQPAISLVNRTLRNESLPIFYGTNSIHIELANFEYSKEGMAHGVKRLPCDWWRAIGDDWLKYIRRLSILGQKGYPEYHKHKGIRIAYTARDSIDGLASVADQAYPWEDQYPLEGNLTVRENEKMEIQPHLTALAKNGVHLRVLDDAVAWLEPERGRYLRTGSALDVSRNFSGPSFP